MTDFLSEAFSEENATKTLLYAAVIVILVQAGLVDLKRWITNKWRNR